MVITIATNSCEAKRRAPRDSDDCTREGEPCGSYGPCCPGLYCDFERSYCVRF